jgi:phenylacetate-CoA ligase
VSEQHPVLSAFRVAAAEAPAYAQILAERGVRPDEVRTLDDFHARVPLLDKAATFGRFRVSELCRGGNVGRPAAVLTSSGHSGRFAFGLYAPDAAEAESGAVDDALDAIFAVRAKPTLLINALPMGVRVPTRSCTLADTSVRPDMVTAIVRQFSAHYAQTILVGETAFLKLVLELGLSQGIDWRAGRFHAIVGEEPIAENARAYLAGILGIDPARPETGIIGSSMGVAELGLNLFFEPPPLIALRHALHRDASLRRSLPGPATAHVPMLFVYDPRRVYVEVADGDRLVVTTLDPTRRLPLIRYRTGDVASLPDAAALTAVAARATSLPLPGLPVVFVHGRGEHVRSEGGCVYPEQVKEGLYHDAALARLTTANFRLCGRDPRAILRIQLSPGIQATPNLADRFRDAVAQYVPTALEVRCEAYEAFGDGMVLDYERKFPYLEPGQT